MSEIAALQKSDKMSLRDSVAIVVNGFYQSPAYTKQINRLLAEIEAKGSDAFVFKNDKPNMIGDKYLFKKAVYLDKDIAFASILEGQGIRLFNSSKAIELADNKRKTLCFLANAKTFELPKTLFNPLNYKNEIDKAFFAKIHNILKFPYIIKEAIGSLGEQVYLVNNAFEAQIVASRISKTEFFYQEYIKKSKGRSLRYYVVGGQPLGAIRFINEFDFRSNTARGSKLEPAKLRADFADAALEAVSLLGLDYGAVDFFDLEAPLLIEVNSNAYFESFEGLGIPVAEKIAKLVIEGGS